MSEVLWVLSLKNIVITLMVLMAILMPISALVIDAPAVVDVHQKEEFYIEIENTENTVQNLSVNFYSTSNVTTFAPSTVPANSSVKVKVIVNNTYDSYTEVESKLEVTLGNKFQDRKIILRFFEEENQGEQFVEGANAFFSAIAVNSFFTLENYSLLEISAMTVLILLIIVLAIALIVRIVKRV